MYSRIRFTYSDGKVAFELRNYAPRRASVTLSTFEHYPVSQARCLANNNANGLKKHRRQKASSLAYTSIIFAIMSQPTISSSDRIRELSTINADVAAMLSSAGNAINALTNRPSAIATNGDANGDADSDINMDDEDTDSTRPIDTHKKAFTQHTTAYFTHLQAIMARLRRQVYALEEAGVITAEAPTLSAIGSSEPAQQRNAPGQGAGFRRGPSGTGAATRQPAEEVERTTNGGLGNLDVGYLNSRGNRVGLEKEAELVAEARTMLEEIVESNGDIQEDLR